MPNPKREPTPTSKVQALAALRDAIEEAGRLDGVRPVVLGALLAEAVSKLEAIQEVKRVRKVERKATA